MRSVFERLTQRQRPVKNQKKKPMPLISAMIFAMLAGALFPLALSPYHCWPLAILSPAIFYFLLHERSGKQAIFDWPQLRDWLVERWRFLAVYLHSCIRQH